MSVFINQSVRNDQEQVGLLESFSAVSKNEDSFEMLTFPIFYQLKALKREIEDKKSALPGKVLIKALNQLNESAKKLKNFCENNRFAKDGIQWNRLSEILQEEHLLKESVEQKLLESPKSSTYRKLESTLKKVETNLQVTKAYVMTSNEGVDLFDDSLEKSDVEMLQTSEKILNKLIINQQNLLQKKIKEKHKILKKAGFSKGDVIAVGAGVCLISIPIATVIGLAASVAGVALAVILAIGLWVSFGAISSFVAKIIGKVKKDQLKNKLENEIIDKSKELDKLLDYKKNIYDPNFVSFLKDLKQRDLLIMPDEYKYEDLFTDKENLIHILHVFQDYKNWKNVEEQSDSFVSLKEQYEFAAKELFESFAKRFDFTALEETKEMS